jgi:hypothetical protein
LVLEVAKYKNKLGSKKLGARSWKQEVENAFNVLILSLSLNLEKLLTF